MISKTNKSPCPFCGKAPISGVEPSDPAREITEFGWVKCENKDCYVRPKVGSTNVIGTAEGRAVELWNYRR